MLAHLRFYMDYPVVSPQWPRGAETTVSPTSQNRMMGLREVKPWLAALNLWASDLPVWGCHTVSSPDLSLVSVSSLGLLLLTHPAPGGQRLPQQAGSLPSFPSGDKDNEQYEPSPGESWLSQEGREDGREGGVWFLCSSRKIRGGGRKGSEGK